MRGRGAEVCCGRGRAFAADACISCGEVDSTTACSFKGLGDGDEANIFAMDGSCEEEEEDDDDDSDDE